MVANLERDIKRRNLAAMFSIVFWTTSRVMKRRENVRKERRNWRKKNIDCLQASLSDLQC